MTIKQISSRSNPWYKKIKDLISDNKAYRAQGRIWLEGDHLCRAAVERGWQFEEMVFTDTVSRDEVDHWRRYSQSIMQLPQPLMDSLSDLGSAAWICGVVVLPQRSSLNPLIPTVVLDRLQDPGNAGSILRSAAAFGFTQIISTPQTVALWSPKVVRSAMGAHFGLQIFESLSVDAILELKMPVLLTSSHQGHALHELSNQQQISNPCMWVLGHEGQGVSQEWLAHPHQLVRIDQPGGEESLNVAAAAAICLYSSSRTFSH